MIKVVVTVVIIFLEFPENESKSEEDWHLNSHGSFTPHPPMIQAVITVAVIFLKGQG